MDHAALLKALEKPTGMVDVILDTDTYNEVDDQFAIAYLLSYADKVNTKAIYAAPFTNQHADTPGEGMEKSYHEILKVLDLMDRNDMAPCVFRGSDRYLPDEKTPVISPAAEHLVEFSKNYNSENRLYVIAIGCITNIASAVLLDPTIIDRIVFVFLGTNSLSWPHQQEFNLMQDVAAGRVVFNSGMPLVVIPCKGVVSNFPVSQFALVHLMRGKNKLCDYLVDNVIKDTAPLWPEGYAWSRTLWDVTAIAWLTTDYCPSYIIPCPVPEYDHVLSFPPDRHPIRYVYHIEHDPLVYDMCERLAAL